MEYTIMEFITSDTYFTKLREIDSKLGSDSSILWTKN